MSKLTHCAHILLSGALASCLCVCAAPAPPISWAASTADPPDGSTTPINPIQPPQKNGLVKESGFVRYYVKGKPLTSSWKKIKGAKYYFNSKGDAVTGTSAKIKGVYYVFGNNGKLLVSKRATFKKLARGVYYVKGNGKVAKTGWVLKSSKLHYVAKSGRCAAGKKVDGIKFSKDGVAVNDRYTKLKIYCMKQVAKRCKSSMSTREKLRQLWIYGEDGHRFVNSTEPKDVGHNGWMQRRAYEVAYSHEIECFGRATLFAALAYEIGCKPIVHAYPAIHAYVEINGRYYDNMMVTVGASAPQSDMRFFPTYKMISWRDTTNNHKDKKSNAASKKSKKNGLVKSGSSYCFYKDGIKVKSSWRTVEGARYYFKSNGKAATGSYGIKKNGTVKYYVFSAKGKLSTGKGTHFATVSGVKYRVAANGRAASGWDSSKTRYYLANGTLACGVHVVKGKLLASSPKGVYNAELTARLRTAAVINSSPTTLIELLGTPLKVKTQPSCYFYNGVTGEDHVYYYEHVVIYALIDDGAATEYFYSAEER